MSEKNPFRLWKETVSSKSHFRDSLKGMHLAVLPHARQQKLEENVLFIQFKLQDFVLCELKGRPTQMANIELPVKDRCILWLCLQFHGQFSFSNGRVSHPDSFFSFKSEAGDDPLTVPAEKIWSLFLGISGASQQQILSEYAQLRNQYDTQEKKIAPAISITYHERQTLTLFSKKSFGSFTTLHHIGQLMGKLYASYTQQLVKHKDHEKEETAMLLYHKAITYIQKNYLDSDLNRITISDALCCSTRNLSRAFEGRSMTLNSTITLIRLHKARELLRRQPDLAIDHVAAQLHFTNAKHFATQYKKYFHHSPREERKIILDWK